MKDTLGTDFTNVPAETDPLTYHMINKERAEEYLRFIGSFSKNIVPLVWTIYASLTHPHHHHHHHHLPTDMQCH